MTILDKESLGLIVQEYTRISESIWYKHLYCVNITKCSKAWWKKEYQVKLMSYRSSKLIEGWKTFKRIIKKTKKLFFNDKIQEFTLKNCRLWDLMIWVKKCKIPAIEVLQYNGQSILSNFVYPNQLGRLKQYSTIDVGIFLTYLI